VSDSTAQAFRLSTEKEHRYGKTDRVSEQKGYYFTVWEDTFAHCPRMGGAIWLFLWYIARTTREDNGVGSVLGDTPILDARPAGELHVSVKTVRRWRLNLVRGGFVDAKRTPYGHRITLLNSRKWRSRGGVTAVVKSERELPKRSTQSGHASALRADRSGQNKVESKESKEREQEKRAVRSPSDSDYNSRTARSSYSYKRKAKPKTLKENLAKRIQERFITVKEYFRHDPRFKGDRLEWQQRMEEEKRQWFAAANSVGYVLDISDPCVCVDFLDKLLDAIPRTRTEADRTTKARVCMKVIDACTREKIPYPPTFLAHKDHLWSQESRRTTQ
jgi:hypothetical protein